MQVHSSRYVELVHLLDHSGLAAPYVERRAGEQTVVPEYFGLEAGQDLQTRFALYDAVAAGWWASWSVESAVAQ